jgi:hypothetical protein
VCFKVVCFPVTLFRRLLYEFLPVHSRICDVWRMIGFVCSYADLSLSCQDDLNGKIKKSICL